MASLPMVPDSSSPLLSIQAARIGSTQQPSASDASGADRVPAFQLYWLVHAINGLVAPLDVFRVGGVRKLRAGFEGGRDALRSDAGRWVWLWLSIWSVFALPVRSHVHRAPDPTSESQRAETNFLLTAFVLASSIPAALITQCLRRWSEWMEVSLVEAGERSDGRFVRASWTCGLWDVWTLPLFFLVAWLYWTDAKGSTWVFTWFVIPLAMPPLLVTGRNMPPAAVALSAFLFAVQVVIGLVFAISPYFSLWFLVGLAAWIAQGILASVLRVFSAHPVDIVAPFSGILSTAAMMRHALYSYSDLPIRFAIIGQFVALRFMSPAAESSLVVTEPQPSVSILGLVMPTALQPWPAPLLCAWHCARSAVVFVPFAPLRRFLVVETTESEP
jgi:hypothetical protein